MKLNRIQKIIVAFFKNWKSIDRECNFFKETKIFGRKSAKFRQKNLDDHEQQLFIKNSWALGIL